MASVAMATSEAMFHAILVAFFSLKVVAFWRLVISASRGWRQLPGLSCAAGEACCPFIGVESVLCNVDDIL